MQLDFFTEARSEKTTHHNARQRSVYGRCERTLGLRLQLERVSHSVAISNLFKTSIRSPAQGVLVKVQTKK